MKQLLNSFSTGEISLREIAKPNINNNQILIKNHYSAISVGTEKMLVDFGKANYFQKAKQQPEKVKQVIDKVKTDGLTTTYNAVKSKLDQPIPLGYSSVGEVIEVGENCTEYKVGDLVISNGSHSEIVAVNKNLVAKVPDGVSLENAAFTVISSIPLQGIRLLNPEIGDVVVVIGLGLMGLIASQILIANGCTVIGTDMDPNKIEIAKSYGVDAVNVGSGIDIVKYVHEKTGNFGADKILITASTKSNDPITQSAKMVRQRGKIVLVGVVGLDLDRNLFYEKEITFQVSSSYGPGRYDKNYEEQAIDYPYGFVRWTQNRNFQAILELIKNNKLNLDNLITHRVDFNDATNAYNDLSSNSNVIGAIFKYNHETVNLSDTVKNSINNKNVNAYQSAIIGVIGAGNFTNQTLLPKIDKKFRLKKIASHGGLTASNVSLKHGIEESTSNSETIFSDSEINTVVVTTRHDTHFNFVKKAIESGKSVFVEKPLALTMDELDELDSIASNHHIMVGFNRRYSPLILKMKELLKSTVAPKNINITVNAGSIPKNHWTQDKNIGGGRLIGEACHFIDLAFYIAESKIIDSYVLSMDDNEEKYDTFTIILKFENGSIATINYFANGSKSYPKENIKVTCEEKILEIDNFKTLKGYGFSDFKSLKNRNQDKGHATCINKFLESVSSNKPLISFEDLMSVSRLSVKLDEEMRR